MTTDPRDAEIARLMAERRMIVSHATMGQTDGEGLSVNAISVKITALRNELYQDGAARAEKAEAALAESEAAVEGALMILVQTQAERDAALAQVAALREVVKFHERLTVDPSTLSHRDAQMRAEGRKDGLREAAAMCNDTAQEALEESGAESRAIWTWFRGQRDAILAAVEREAPVVNK